MILAGLNTNTIQHGNLTYQLTSSTAKLSMNGKFVASASNSSLFIIYVVVFLVISERGRCHYHLATPNSVQAFNPNSYSLDVFNRAKSPTRASLHSPSVTEPLLFRRGSRYGGNGRSFGASSGKCCYRY